jgi:hypothetical protein
VFKDKKPRAEKKFLAMMGSEASHFGSQSGQAAIEYILVLVVVVSIALGVMYQLNDAMKKYVQSYFGDYVACLLETGELPSLGGSGGINADTCDAEYEAFSLQNGRPLKEGDGSGGSSSSSNSSGRSRSTDGGSRVTRNNSSLNGERANGGSGAAAGSINKNKRTELSRGSASSDVSQGARALQQRNRGQVRINTKIKMNKEKTVAKSVDLNGKLRGRSPKKILVDMEKFRRKPAQASTDFDLSFGDYIRYIIIFAILIVILIFFGGQLNQLRKSWDNN